MRQSPSNHNVQYGMQPRAFPVAILNAEYSMINIDFLPLVLQVKYSACTIKLLQYQTIHESSLCTFSYTMHNMHRLYHEVEVFTGFTHRGPEARGCVNRVDSDRTEQGDNIQHTRIQLLMHTISNVLHVTQLCVHQFKN